MKSNKVIHETTITWLFKEFFGQNLSVSFRIHPQSCYPNIIGFCLNITICCTTFRGVLFVGHGTNWVFSCTPVNLLW